MWLGGVRGGKEAATLTGWLPNGNWLEGRVTRWRRSEEEGKGQL